MLIRMFVHSSLLTALFLLISSYSFSQSDTTVRYYKSSNTGKDIPQGRAEYSETKFTNADGSVTTQIYDLKKKQLASSSTYKGNEPVGIWKAQWGMQVVDLDYDFAINYKEGPSCAGTYLEPGVGLAFENNDSTGYKAPEMAYDEKSIFSFINKNIIYPAEARDNDISGKVLIRFLITETGQIENIQVVRSVHILLDKEAVRVLRLLKLKTPPMINGQPVKVCAAFPFVFRLQ